MKKKKRDLKIRFGRMQMVIAAFIVLAAALCIVQRNVSYDTRERLLEPAAEEAFSEVTPATSQQEAECLILWEDDAGGRQGLDLMEPVLEQMKVPYEVCEGRYMDQVDLANYEKIVLSMTNWDLMDEGAFELMEWVEAGGGLMVLYPPNTNGYFQLFEQTLGIETLGNKMSVVEEIHFTRDFMLGGSRNFQITDPYESALEVNLAKDCTVYLESAGEHSIPLIWSRDVGEGRIVVDNLGFLTKDYRGFYSSSYSLLGRSCVYPVINASTFYIDDFPSPVPGGNSTYIQEDYGMSIEEFYTQVWWNQIYELAEKYNIRYTGLVIENYSDQVEGPFPRNRDTQRFQYFGNMLLRQGGEIGYHGYNHMPLCLVGFDYQGDYDSYNLWESYEDMVEAMRELHAFCTELFPEESFRVYVPPSNILSDEGRKMLAEEFPDLVAVASLYLPGDISYIQEFEVAEDGIVETPRIISGYIFEPDIYVAALSELNFHLVNTHFQHPDDVLDEDRGAKLGWEEMYGRISQYMEWLYDSAPSVRNLTGTELAGAVQVYDMIEVKRAETEDSLQISLEGFSDEAWLMVRINEGMPGNVTGGSLEKLQEDLYLLKAVSPEIVIEIR